VTAPTPWYLPIARAVPALVLAGVITFTPDHSAPLGFVTFGAFGVITGAVVAAGALRRAGADRIVGLVQGILSIVAGIAALLLPGGGLPLLILIVTGWAALTGFAELYLGLRARGREPGARDRLFAGALTVLLAVGLLLVPPQLAQPLGGIEGVEGVLTASVVVVGVLGAYWAVLGVFLIIGGLSLRWADAPQPSGSTA
jgi:uncharacterized membrane protein HdeD (DUF308 family)